MENIIPSAEPRLPEARRPRPQDITGTAVLARALSSSQSRTKRSTSSCPTRHQGLTDTGTRATPAAAGKPLRQRSQVSCPGAAGRRPPGRGAGSSANSGYKHEGYTWARPIASLLPAQNLSGVIREAQESPTNPSDQGSARASLCLSPEPRGGRGPFLRSKLAPSPFRAAKPQRSKKAQGDS